MHHLKKASTLLFAFVLVAITPSEASLSRIKDEQINYLVPLGAAVDFDCRLSDPNAIVELFHSSKHIPTDGVKIAEVGQMFTVYNISLADSGKYKCKSPLTDSTKKIFQVGSITALYVRNLNLKLNVSPKINTATEGESTSFACQASSSKFASVGWYKDTNELNNQNKSSNGNDNTSVVKLSDLKTSESGEYECRVKVQIYQGYRSGFFPANAELIVQRFKFISREQTVFVGYVGSSITIHCNTTDPIATTNLWIQRSHQNLQQVTPDGVKIVQTGPRFVIHSVTVQDGGKYFCKAVSTYGKSISMDMGRFFPLQGGYRDPKAYISPLTKNLVLDNNFNFTCQAFGDSINFTWYKDGSVVPSYMVTVFPRRLYQGYTMFQSILTIRNAERSDEGLFTCQITSALQPGYSHSVTANLTIYECPKANGKFRDPFNSTMYIECVNGTGTRKSCPFSSQYWDDSLKDCIFPATTPTTMLLNWMSDDSQVAFVAPRSSFLFDCRLTDHTVPVQLKMDGKPVTVDGTKVKQSGQKFTISNLQTRDNGKYSCHASGVGNSKVIQINIHKDLSLELSVHVIGSTNPIELETTFHKTLVCESLYLGEIHWFKVDPQTNTLALVTKGPAPKTEHRKGYMVTIAYLELSDVSKKDAGMYMCRKNNSYTVANRTVEIIVKAPIKPTVSTSLQNTIKENKPLQLKVVVSGSPFPDVTWYKDQQALVTCRGGQSFTCKPQHGQSNYEIDDHIDVSNRNPTSNLHFKIIKPSHPVNDGVYLIKVKNLVGEDQRALNISVIVPPTIKKTNKEVEQEVILNNSPHSLVCQVTRAVPTPEITWKYQVLSCSSTMKCKSNPTKWQSISSSVARVIKRTSMSSVLQVVPTDKLIYYQCSVRNTAGSDKKDFALFRTGNLNQALTIEGEKTKYRNEHENITMVCRALKSFRAPPTWYDNENRLINTSRLRITDKEKSTDYISHLQIFGAQVNDSGNYTCGATEKDGTKQMRTTILKVFALSPPSVITANLTVNETNHVTLHCTVSGHPPPTVTWIRQGKSLKMQFLSSIRECSSRLNGFYHLNPKPLDVGKSRMHSLVICNAKYANNGWYTCKAGNIISQDERQAYLNVQAPPTVSFTNNDLPDTLRLGDSLVINCQATGNPTPYVRWLKQSDNGSFASLGNISTWTSGSITLKIPELKRVHYGKYRCIATNVLGHNHKDHDISKQPLSAPGFTDRKYGTVSKPALIAIVVSGSLVILLLLVIIAVLYRRKRLYGGFYILTLPPMPDYIKRLDPSRPLQEQTHKLPLCADWEFSRNRLTLGKVIGSGAFGQVFVADAVGIVAFDPRSSMKGKGSRRRSRFGSTRSPYYNNKQVTVVACKGLKEDATESDYRDLVSELKILMHIGEHKNIVNLLGACTKGRECDLLVIIEYCSHGNLLEFLRPKRDLFEAKWEPATEEAEERFTTTDLVITAFQVARAMDFLASRRCVHRDLAARNVLVGENYVMKVADFGLARDIYKNEHYVKTTGGLLPVKWMAIEALVDRIYTHQSDVWSFGVLLWEIFTLGGSPYPGLPANEVYQYLMEGQRMEQPHDCPDEIYALMLGCWEHDASSRPTFTAILQTVDKLLEEKTTQTGEEYLELENEQDLFENQPYYLEPEDMHPVSPLFDSPHGSPLPPIPAEEIELQHLIRHENGQDYLNNKEFLFCDLPKSRTNNHGSGREIDKARADSMEKENKKKSESSGNLSDEEEFISEKEHLMKNFDDEKDVCERNSEVFDTPTPYINTTPYANVNSFIKNYGNDGATSKKEDDFRPRQQSARYV